VSATHAPPLPSPASHDDGGMTHREVVTSTLLPFDGGVGTVAGPRLGGVLTVGLVAALRDVPLGGKRGIDIARERAHPTDRGATP
jgi:hypothetical protein